MKSVKTIAFLLGAMGFGCNRADPFEGTLPPPGPDPGRFAPWTALPAVLTYAGPQAVLDSVTLVGVKEDGTIDLTAAHPTGARYVLSVAATSPPELARADGAPSGAVASIGWTARPTPFPSATRRSA